MAYEAMRAALRRNIEGLTHLDEDAKASLLETEFGACVAATEANRPFVDIYGQTEQATDEAEDYTPETPGEGRAPVAHARRGWAR